MLIDIRLPLSVGQLLCGGVGNLLASLHIGGSNAALLLALFQIIIKGPVRGVTHTGIKSGKRYRAPIEVEVVFLFFPASRSRIHAQRGADGGIVVVIIGRQLFVLVTTAYGQIEAVEQFEFVAGCQADTVVLGVGYRGVSEGRINNCGLVGYATTAVGIAAGIGRPEVGVEIHPRVTLGLEFVFQVVGFAFHMA
ncbi:hypothetical protein D3C77_277800 [compost metagenome]